MKLKKAIAAVVAIIMMAGFMPVFAAETFDEETLILSDENKLFAAADYYVAKNDFSKLTGTGEGDAGWVFMTKTDLPDSDGVTFDGGSPYYLGLSKSVKMGGGYPANDWFAIEFVMSSSGNDEYNVYDINKQSIFGGEFGETYYTGHGERNLSAAEKYVLDNDGNKRAENYLKTISEKEFSNNGETYTANFPVVRDVTKCTVIVQNTNGTITELSDDVKTKLGVDSYTGDFYTVKTFADGKLAGTDYYSGRRNGIGYIYTNDESTHYSKKNFFMGLSVYGESIEFPEPSPEPSPEASLEPSPSASVNPDPIPSATKRPPTPGVLPYLDTALSFEERAADLVSRMTLKEKAQQTGRTAPAISRLGVSSYDYWKEGIHGVARQGAATSFPTSLAMSNTWDRELIRQTMDITGTEARGKNARYNLSYWNPTINIGRDPRWGRNEESYGEDPFVTSEAATQAILGMRGTDKKYLKVAPTLKHIAANNCEGERQTGSSVITEKTFREYYGRAFEDTIEDASPEQIMSSYNALTLTRNGKTLISSTGQPIDYIATTANTYLFNDFIRRTTGYRGLVVGDCGAWENLYGRQPIRQKLYPDLPLSDITATMAVAKAYEAGGDLDCGSRAQISTYDAVQEGLVTEEQLDVAVYRLMLMRMKLGEFDNGAVYQDTKSDVIEKDEHVAVSEKASEESWVLLKNDDNILPMKNDVKNVAVVGGLADEVILGDYTGSPTKTVSPYAGISEEIKSLNPNAEVNLVGSVPSDEVLFNIKSINLVLKDGKKRAVDLSKATSISGMDKSGSNFKNVTKKGYAVIKGVDFSNVKSVEVEMATGDCRGGTVSIQYGEGGPTQSTVYSEVTGSLDEYKVCSAEYGTNGDDGGYNGKADMCITAAANMPDFTVDTYREQLDKADVIIAYASTIPKGSGLGTQDASESIDRASLDMPAHESHVAKIAEVYPEKTVVVMQTVGQIDIEPFKNCKSILWTAYNGQKQGTALGRILTGEANPPGKLTQTWYQPSDLAKMPIGSKTETVNNIGYNNTNYELSYDINRPEADWPGRTYMYYSGTPVYPFGYGMSYTKYKYSNIQLDKDEADANDTVKIKADIENVGSTAGAEIAQLYITVPGADGKILPFKQLKGYQRVVIEPGEKKTVEFDLNIADVFFFDETAQKNYVINGDYTIMVGANSNDADALTAKLNVTGMLSEEIKNIYSIPSGITLYSAKSADGTTTPANAITADTSIALDNDYVYFDATEFNEAEIKYESSDKSVAIVDNRGIVISGGSEGTAVITASATYNGKTVTSTFPVVTVLREKVSDEKKAEYLNKLETEYGKYIEAAYAPENWSKIQSIYDDAKVKLETALLDENLDTVYSEAVEKFKSVPAYELTKGYKVLSENSNIIKNGKIDYDENGIGEYTAGETTINGTITRNNPYVIKLNAVNNSNAVITDNLYWNVEKADSSSRKPAEINRETGELKLYENGVFKITVKDFNSKIFGELVVYANLQIEGESADNNGGADLSDEKAGASGGLCAGNTGTGWIRFDGVKIDRLQEIAFRVSQKEADSIINISLSPSTDRLIGSVTVPMTGAWTNWTTVNAVINRLVTEKLNLDENGCGTIYVQTNKSNLDFLQCKYIDSNMDAVCKPNGKIDVNWPFDNGVLIEAKYNGDGTLNDTKFTDITSTGTYTIEGYQNGDILKLMAWDGTDTMQPLTESIDMRYEAPEVKTVTVYNFSDSAFDSFYETPAGEKLVSGTGMDGIGGWTTQSKKRTYQYTDGSGKTTTYNFTRGLKGGRGGRDVTCVYFTPDTDGLVTALFDGGAGREMNIDQEGKEVVTKQCVGDGTVIAIEAYVKAGVPVYIYGGGANKYLWAVIFDTEKQLGTASTSDIETTDSNKISNGQSFKKIVKYNDAVAGLTGGDNTQVMISTHGEIWTDITPKEFAESDLTDGEGLFMNDIISNSDQLYIGCNNGILVTITPCGKCATAKRVCSFDIGELEIVDNILYLYSDNESKEISLTNARQSNIEAEAALKLAAEGALLVDVRSKEEYSEESYKGSINVTVDEFEEWIKTTDREQKIIVYCSSGSRAKKAIDIAYAAGHTNIYNLGSINELK